jgi:hypothetical protein
MTLEITEETTTNDHETNMKNDEEFIYDRIRMLEEIAKLQDTNEEN